MRRCGLLLLGMVAGLAAHAADRGPIPQTAALTLRPCPDGGFALPGSSGCVRLSGQLEAATALRIGGGVPRRGVSLRGGAQGRVAADVRVPTGWGPVRVYTSVRVGSAPEPGVLRP